MPPNRSLMNGRFLAVILKLIAPPAARFDFDAIYRGAEMGVRQSLRQTSAWTSASLVRRINVFVQ